MVLRKKIYILIQFFQKKTERKIFFLSLQKCKNQRIYLCLAHMSGNEMKYIQEAFDTNWVVPLGPNVNGFEDDLKK